MFNTTQSNIHLNIQSPVCFFWFFLVLFFVILTSPLFAGSNEILVLIKLNDIFSMETIPSENITLYYKTDDFVLVGIRSNQISLLRDLDGHIIDRDPWSSDYAYYFVFHNEIMLQDLVKSGNGTLLYSFDNQILMKMRPETAEKLLQQGYEIVLVNRQAKPWEPITDSDILRKGNRDFAGVITTMVNSVSQLHYAYFVQTLQDFDTRYTNTASIDNAADWIYNTFENYGLDVDRHYFTIYSTTKQNIIATRTGVIHPDEVIFVTAHYDSISEDPYNFAPGADDNASGTAAVLEIARILANFVFERTIKFACFAGEEQGLVGSMNYVEDIYNQGMNVIGCYNLDMIGYSGNDTAPSDLMIYSNSGSSALAIKLYDAAVYFCPTKLEPFVDYSGFGASDHASFWQYGYDGILAIEAEPWGADFNPYYHTTNDLLVHCDMEYATNCTKVTLAAVADFASPTFAVPTLSPLGIVLIILVFSAVIYINSRIFLFNKICIHQR